MKVSPNMRDYLWWLPLGVVLFTLIPVVGAGKALAYTTVCCVFSVIITEKWEKRQSAAFWMIILPLAMVHVIAVALIQIPTPSAGLIAVPFGFLDLLATMAVITWLEQRFPRI